MRKIVYYVASSLDGFICGDDDDISAYVGSGSGVEQYLSDLKEFDTVIMGRNTYEFGYRFGMKPGQLAYPHMKHYIFSSTLKFDQCDPNLHVVPLSIEEMTRIRMEPGSDIYLCGGAQLAGWLLDHGQIDLLRIKLNPIILGSGKTLFGESRSQRGGQLIDSKAYDDGLQIMTYSLS